MERSEHKSMAELILGIKDAKYLTKKKWRREDV